MTRTTRVSISAPQVDGDACRLYQTISRNPRYGHYVRIPARICKCLDYFGVAYDRTLVEQTLHAYYLFIGVVDDALDEQGLCAGTEILDQLSDPLHCFDEQASRSPVKLATEILKSRIRPEIYAPVLGGLNELYEAVVQEQLSITMDEYLRARKRVGRLTAELSHLLIEPLIHREPRARDEHKRLRHFLTKVGEVGCLIDSLIDLRSDHLNHVISFRPTIADHLKLTIHVLYEGSRILLARPRLLGLFLEATTDDLRDKFRRPAPSLASAAVALDL